MKKKLHFFVALFCIIMAVSSCKKDKPTPSAKEDHSEHFAYYKGVVQDSITGVLIPNMYTFSGRYDTTDLNATYVHYYRWEGKPGFSGYTRFADGVELGVAAGGLGYYGVVTFTAGQLIENDTITLSPLKVNPIGYLKIHMKDTSGVSMDMGLNKILYPNFPFNAGYHFLSYVDSTYTYGAVSGKSVMVDWSYTKSGALIHPPAVPVFVTPGDTSSFDILY